MAEPKNLYQNGPSQSYNLDVRGGTQAIRYFLSGNYDNDEGIVYYNYDKPSGCAPTSASCSREKFTLDVSTGFVDGKTRFRQQAASDGGEWEDLVWGNGYCIARASTPARTRARGCSVGFQEHLPPTWPGSTATRDYSRFTGQRRR